MMPGLSRLSPAQLELVRDMRERGKSYGQIRLRLALEGVTISVGALSWRCLQLGAEPPSRRSVLLDPRRSPPKGRSFSAEEDAAILRLEAEGKGSTAIGRAMGRAHNSIIGRQLTLARHAARRDCAAGIE